MVLLRKDVRLVLEIVQAVQLGAGGAAARWALNHGLCGAGVHINVDSLGGAQRLGDTGGGGGNSGRSSDIADRGLTGAGRR